MTGINLSLLRQRSMFDLFELGLANVGVVECISG